MEKEKEDKVTSSIKTGDIGYLITFLMFGFVFTFSVAITICDIMEISIYPTIAIGLVASIFGISLFLFLALPFVSTPEHSEFEQNFKTMYFKLLFAFLGLFIGSAISYPLLKNSFETPSITLLCTIFCGCLSAFILPAFNMLLSKGFNKAFSEKNNNGEDIIIRLPIQLTYDVALLPFIIVIGIPILLIGGIILLAIF